MNSDTKCSGEVHEDFLTKELLITTKQSHTQTAAPVKVPLVFINKSGNSTFSLPNIIVIDGASTF